MRIVQYDSAGKENKMPCLFWGFSVVVGLFLVLFCFVLFCFVLFCFVLFETGFLCVALAILELTL